MRALYCTSAGAAQGEPVLFLHASSFSGTMWREITNRLPEFRCILPDLPGHGRSRHKDLVSLAQAADCIAERIVNAHGGRPVNIVGLSFGGYVGLMLIARHPELVKRAMLSGIHIGAIPNPRVMNLIAALMSPLIAVPWIRQRMAASMGVTDPRMLHRADGTANVTARTFRRIINLVSVFDVHNLLPQIVVPTLLIAGEDEHITILRSLHDYQRLMPHCVARTVPAMGHAWCNQDPDLFAEIVTAWVKGRSLPEKLMAPKLQLLR
ncbi:MAG: alpha/beta hydrolase [Pseudomonadota bacterium]